MLPTTCDIGLFSFAGAQSVLFILRPVMGLRPMYGLASARSGINIFREDDGYAMLANLDAHPKSRPKISDPT